MDLKAQFQKAHMSDEDITLIRWKNDNPLGFERAMDQTISGHLEVLNAQRYDEDRPLLSEQDKEQIIDELPENPDEIQARTGLIAQSLSPEATEWKDSMTDITNNLDLAGQLLLHQDEFEDADLTGLVTASQAIAGSYDMTLSEAVDGLGISVSDDLKEKITEMEQPESSADVEAEAEAVMASLPTPGQPQF